MNGDAQDLCMLLVSLETLCTRRIKMSTNYHHSMAMGSVTSNPQTDSW